MPKVRDGFFRTNKYYIQIQYVTVVEAKTLIHRLRIMWGRTFIFFCGCFYYARSIFIQYCGNADCFRRCFYLSYNTFARTKGESSKYTRRFLKAPVSRAYTTKTTKSDKIYNGDNNKASHRLNLNFKTSLPPAPKPSECKVSRDEAVR